MARSSSSPAALTVLAPPQRGGLPDKRLRDDDRLQPADRIKLAACPDHSHGSRARFAVIAEQVVAHRFDQAAIGGLVMGERFGWLASADQVAREIVVPGLYEFGRLQDLVAGNGPVA